MLLTMARRRFVQNALFDTRLFEHSTIFIQYITCIMYSRISLVRELIPLGNYEYSFDIGKFYYIEKYSVEKLINGYV